MRPLSDRSWVPFGTAFAACALVGCGTLAAPSTGDVDLPASYVGPYQLLHADQTPTGSSALVSPDTSGSIDEPSVLRVTPTARRVAYMTFSVPTQGDTIGRASERADRPVGSLAFDGATSIFSATQAWEGSFVRSPDARAIDATHIVMAYAAQGGIGIATSSDGTTFVHATAPVIAGDALDGGTNSPAEPTLARSVTGEWFMVYRRGTSLYEARAHDPNGPWMDNAAPILMPSQVESPDAGNAFDSVALGDPSLTILATPSGRALFVLFYTATGPPPLTGMGPQTAIGAAASYDGLSWSRLPRTVFVPRTNNVRVGSLDIVDARTALLWIGTGAVGSRSLTALIGPVVARVSAPGS